MNTSRAAFKTGCRARQARRAAATSGRSCSAACWVFFSSHATSGEKATDRGRADLDSVGRQPVAQFGERKVRLSRQERVHPLGVRGQLRTLAAADPIGRERAAAAPALHQLDHEARADLELGGGRPPRCPSLHGAHYPRAQIHRIRSCHPSLASSIQQTV
jgi:hypothetical protein